jgi:hypothetical protein
MNQYHPKLLKIFTQDQLDILADHSFCCVDEKDRICILYSNMDFGNFEIDCGPDEENNDDARIYVLFSTTWEGENIGTEEFWELYTKSKPQECESIYIDF